MQAVPDFHVFNAGYEAGSPQLVRRKAVVTPSFWNRSRVERFAVDIR